MFSHPDYLPLAGLWPHYRQAHYAHVYSVVAEFYASPDFKAERLRGSPLDVCEHLFLRSAERVGLYLCGMDGRTARFAPPPEKAGPTVLSTLSPYNSALAIKAAQMYDSDQLNQLEKRAGLEFEVFWHHETYEANFWTETYPFGEADQAAERSHTIPIGFERPTFQIAKTTPELLCTFPPWMLEFFDDFGGFSLCIAKSDQGEWAKYHSGKKSPYDVLSSANRGPGRPPSSRPAVEAFRKLYPDGKPNDVTWRRIADEIQDEFGITIKPGTLRKAV